MWGESVLGCLPADHPARLPPSEASSSSPPPLLASAASAASAASSSTPSSFSVATSESPVDKKKDFQVTYTKDYAKSCNLFISLQPEFAFVGENNVFNFYT